MNRLVVILVGPPGAGKGTLGLLLAEKLNLFYFETSKILEENFNRARAGEFIEIGGKKYSLAEEKKRWERGDLNSPPLVNHWVEKKIKQLAEEGRNLVLSGSPRSIYEAKRLIPLLEKLYGRENIKILLLELDLETSVFRNSHRRICELMRHPILWNQENAHLTLCPLDGSKLVRRALDQPEIIRKRFVEVYQKPVLPMIEYLKEEGFQVERIDGSPSVAEVFAEISRKLK